MFPHAATAMRNGTDKVLGPMKPSKVGVRFMCTFSAFERGPSHQCLQEAVGPARKICTVSILKAAEAAGLRTHFLYGLNETDIIVQEFSLPNSKRLTPIVHGAVVPLTWRWYSVVTPDLFERLQSGALTKDELGLAKKRNVTLGDALPELYVECRTMFKPVNHRLSLAETKRIFWNHDQKWWESALITVTQAAAATQARYAAAGFSVQSGEVELGVVRKGGTGHYFVQEFVLIDSFGTPDKNRIVDADGEVYSADLIGDYLIEIGWKAKLDQARADHPTNRSKWPKYPTLPRQLVRKISRRYEVLANELARSEAQSH